MSKEIRAEAIRIARGLVLDALRANGMRIGSYTINEITAFAEAVVEDRPEKVIPQAWDNCKMRYEAKREAQR